MLSLTRRFPILDRMISRTAAPDTEAGPEPLHHGLTRSQTVDRILALNPSATADFLDQFDIQDLGDYLEQLTSAAKPRGTTAGRSRPAGSGVSWSERRT